MRGYGVSDVTTDGYDAVNAAKDMRGILEAEGFTKAQLTSLVMIWVL